MTLFVKTFRTFLLLLLLSSTYLFAQNETKESVDKPATISLWGHEITTLRSSYHQVSPKERAEIAQERILAIPIGLDRYDIRVIRGNEGNVSGAWITVNYRNIFGVMEQDVDFANKETFDQYTQAITVNLQQWLVKRNNQKNTPLLLRGLAFSFGATVIFILLLKIILHFSHRISVRLEDEAENHEKKLQIYTINIRPYLTTLGVGLLKIVTWGLGLPLAYAWITFVFRQFPYTLTWGNQLTTFIVDLLRDFGYGIFDALPGLMAVVVIFMITRLVIRVLDTFFNGIINGTLDVAWMEPETAQASRRVMVVLVWIFALVVAYPYIPGSQTEAFKGITVFLGLMLSLGSAGIIGQILGGIVVVYTRAFQTGDFVKINEYEGNIDEIGVLSTKIKTLRNEEITIPNATLLSATTTNYSRYAKKGLGSRVATTVTIGYDAPWRQVHAMLEMAAKRTDTIRTTPAPLVLQKALSDFYVEYTLLFTIEQPEIRYRVLSTLHGNIQDVFNEFGVQILSPNFEAQPEGGAVFVPKEQWYPAPAKEN